MVGHLEETRLWIFFKYSDSIVMSRNEVSDRRGGVTPHEITVI
jgi:hypothetical protein